MKIFTSRFPKEIVSDFKGELSEIDALGFSGLDIERMRILLESGPAKKYLPRSDKNFRANLPPKNSRNEYEYKKDGNTICIPPELNSFAESTCKFWGKYSQISEDAFIEWFWGYLNRFIKWYCKGKISIANQLEETLLRADHIHQELRDRSREFCSRKENSFFNFILFLPDIFVYMCRLLADKDVPKNYKVSLSLALVYLGSPLDLIPEDLIRHPIALVDDFGIVLHVFNEGLNEKFVSGEKFEKYWPGNKDFINGMSKWKKAVDDVIGEEVIEIILGHLLKKKPAFSPRARPEQ